MIFVKHAYNPSDITPPADHWVHGRARTDCVSVLDVVRPSDGCVHGCIPQADAALVDVAVASARNGHRVWAAMRPRERGAAMRRWAEFVQRNVVALAQLESVVSSRLYHVWIDFSETAELSQGGRR